MNIELRQEAGYWSAYVDGVRTVDRESFAVADRIAGYLRGRLAYDASESAEVAKDIRTWREQW